MTYGGNRIQFYIIMPEKHNLDPLWGSQLTLIFNDNFELREESRSTGCYQTQSQRLINGPIQEVFEAWNNRKTRKKWLREHHFVVEQSIAEQFLRLTWPDSSHSTEINFEAVSEDQTLIELTHHKIASHADALRLKTIWTFNLRMLDRIMQNKSVVVE